MFSQQTGFSLTSSAQRGAEWVTGLGHTQLQVRKTVSKSKGR